MSRLLINEYLKQLDLIKKVSGSLRETIVHETFKDLLKAWGASMTWCSWLNIHRRCGSRKR